MKRFYYHGSLLMIGLGLGCLFIHSQRFSGEVTTPIDRVEEQVQGQPQDPHLEKRPYHIPPLVGFQR